MMNTNAWNLMILPVLIGLGVGAGLGVAGLMLVRMIDALAGHPHSVTPTTSSRPPRHWRPVVVGFGHGPVHRVPMRPSRRRA